ncbi:MAG: hypothetical protein ACK55Z_37235 [bacterium]
MKNLKPRSPHWRHDERSRTQGHAGRSGCYRQPARFATDSPRRTPAVGKVESTG